jgi:WD40 repeat protein
VRAGDISTNGKCAVLVYDGDFLKIWDVDNGISLAELDPKRHKDNVFLCRFLADDKQVITMSYDGTVVLRKVKE